ncbi:LysR family transcriptional regulator [Catellatospora sp. TT07R-123]|uniref:LysR family transcriptional regulator n=1 Tax=Catellatospora sp. TT07R-123 TaxID=2733863 RepID=UPI001B1FC269|nr:LysR family transcriptional regulator [Catellatospora sp. TT07R-123]GHJ47350.1 LysR family transcriptional regulator [Catellatospora sp. TT07R-123]
MELRDIEIFLTLAEELHFGRTAERLRVTPARVSQAIKKQERRIGAPLFERTTRTVRLTPTGKHLYQELSAGYRQIMDGLRAVAANTGGVHGVLTVGAMGAQPWRIADLLDRYRTRHPAVEVRHRDIQPTAPLDELRAREVDVALVWLPVHEPDVAVGPVTHSCDVMLMVGAGHPLAGRESVCWEDLGDCTVLTGTAVPESMEETFHPRHTPSGRPIARGPAVSNWHEQIALVAGGDIVCGVVDDAARFYAWPGIVYVPIRDARPAQWALVWLTAHETPLIRALVQAAADA